MEEENNWCTIESDPGVFTELISSLGVRGVQVEELYGLDIETLGTLEPILGLIFLFKWDGTVQRESKRVALKEENDRQEGVFFARQTVQNACATQAILSILFNLGPSSDGVDLGNELKYFKEVSMALPTDLRGEAIGASDLLRRVHNSFARPEGIYINEESRRNRRGGIAEDPFHFVSLLPTTDTKSGATALYEFDGLQDGPICHGICDPPSTWKARALEVIQEKMLRIQSSSKDGEIRFNLMALVQDRSGIYSKQISENLDKITLLEGETPRDADAISQLQALNAELQMRLIDEQDKLQKYEIENSRRRHNFVPMIMEMLIEMAKQGMLREFAPQ